MRYQIKMRCLLLGMTQRSLMKMVIERTGEKLDTSAFSNYITGSVATPKAERVLAVADIILKELENK